MEASCLGARWHCVINPDDREISLLKGGKASITWRLNGDDGRRILDSIFETLQRYTKGEKKDEGMYERIKYHRRGRIWNIVEKY